MIESLINMALDSGNIGFAFGAICLGLLYRELQDHKRFNDKINEEMVGKDIYTQAFSTAVSISEHYKEITGMLDKLSTNLTDMAQKVTCVENDHTEALAKILTILKERLPRSHD